MEIVQGHQNLVPGRWTSGAVTLGVFDGVHRGHQVVISRALELSRELSEPAVVITFGQHPRETLTNAGPRLIVPLSYRLLQFEQLGVERCLVLAFDRALAALPPEQFVEQVLIERIGAHSVVLGYDCRFGKSGAGSADYLEENRERFGLNVEKVGPVTVDGHGVSSTIIREAIQAGAMGFAAELLGHPVTLHGLIEQGDQRGRTIGFPTANIDPAGFLVPQRGVYLAHAILQDMPYDALVNIGTRPTFESSQKVVVEAHLKGLVEEVYGLPLTLHLIRKIRDEKQFENAEQLAAQIRQDLHQLEC